MDETVANEENKIVHFIIEKSCAMVLWVKKKVMTIWEWNKI